MKNPIQKLAACAVALTAGASLAAEAPPVQPNIVIIFCDDMG